MTSEKIERLLARLESDHNLADADGLEILLQEMERLAAGICDLTVAVPDAREFHDYAALVEAAGLIIANCISETGKARMKAKLALQVSDDVERITTVLPTLTALFSSVRPVVDQTLADCRETMAGIGSPLALETSPVVH